MRTECIGCVWAHSTYPVRISVAEPGATQHQVCRFLATCHWSQCSIEWLLWVMSGQVVTGAGCTKPPPPAVLLWSRLSSGVCSLLLLPLYKGHRAQHACLLPPPISLPVAAEHHGAPPSLLDYSLQGIRVSAVWRDGVAMKINGTADCNGQEEGRQNFLWIIPQDTRGSLRPYSHYHVAGTRVPTAQFWQHDFHRILHVV